jgi:hypothetical protein
MFSDSRLGREEKSIGEEKGVLARFVILFTHIHKIQIEEN